MLILRKGCTVPFPEKLEEGYCVSDGYIIANVSADKIEEVMAHFICMQQEPVFFLLELPSKQDDEKEVRPGAVNELHKDVYYIDGCSTEKALTVLSRIGKLAINDGLCSFGFGGHESHDEIMFGKYNITTVFSSDITHYDHFFKQHDIERNDHLVVAWDTFSKEHPGCCERVETDGTDVFSIPEQFADWGMYLAEQRVDE